MVSVEKNLVKSRAGDNPGAAWVVELTVR